MRTQSYYERLKRSIHDQLREELPAGVRIDWSIMKRRTLAILRQSGPGNLALEINLKAAERCGTDFLCRYVIPRVQNVRSAQLQMPDSYLQGLAWLEDLHGLSERGSIVMHLLPSAKELRKDRKCVFTAADLYGTVCAGEMCLLKQLPEICFCGGKTADSSLLRALNQAGVLLEQGSRIPIVRFASEGTSLCSLRELCARCEKEQDPFWCGALLRLMAVAEASMPEGTEQILRHQSGIWRRAWAELWNGAQDSPHPILAETLDVAGRLLLRLDRARWSMQSGQDCGSVHLY